MNMTKVEFPQTFKKQEGQGLLANYSDEDQSIGSALNKRMQKLSETKLQTPQNPEQKPTL